MKGLRRFLALSPVKRRLFVLATVWLWLTRLVLVVVPFRRARQTLSVLVTVARRALPTHNPPDPGDLRWAIATATRLGPRNCLIRALAAQALIELLGGQGSLVIGTRRNHAGALEAHAWLEQDGRIIVGAQGGAFATIGRFERIGG